MSSPPQKVRTLDVRALIAQGDEPFTKIMAVVNSLGAGDSFLLITPFVPAPLIEKLQSEGFEAKTELRPDGGWQTRFTRPR